MANSLKNVFLSPKFLSPLSSPSSRLIGIPKSDVNLLKITRPNVVKRLDFSPQPRKPCIPEIKVESANFEANKLVLELNTPNKKDLIQHGLDKFKKRASILGKGTFGTVFKGRHKGETVAVKIVCNARQEKNVLGLNHQNIIKTLEIIQNSDCNNYSLIVMEYFPNCRNLQKTLDTQHLEGEILSKIAKDITRGLNYMYKKWLMHLDLKPKNILLDNENTCRICDFGNSLRVVDDVQNYVYNGTVSYAAPEILLSGKPSLKSDVYSLGLIFWQLKHNKVPFQEFESNESIIYNVGKFDVRPKFTADCCKLLVSLIIKCWNKSVEARPDCEYVLMELEKVEF